MRTLLFIGVVTAQVGFLLGWAGWHGHVRDTAPTILLATRPGDPRDPLRGDYMTLRYDISNVPFPPNETPPPITSYPTNSITSADREIWVVLEREGEYYGAVSSSMKKPANLAANQVLVRGEVGAWWPAPIPPATSPKTLPVNYGIEQYFVPEGQGRPSFKTLEVEASVSPDHYLYIKRLFVDGKAYP